MAPGKSASSVASAGYTINLKAAATPTFSPAGATYASAQTVTIASVTAGANIFYTTDGSIPTTASTLYAGPVTVSTSQTLTAIAMAAGYANSGAAAAAYTIQPVVSAPTISSLSPNSVPPGNAGFTLTVYGANFIPGATVLWNSTVAAASSASTTAPIRNIAIRNASAVSREDTQSSGTALTTTFVSSTELQAAVPASLVATAGSITVSVTDSEGSSGNTPTNSTFAVGAPTIAGIFPASVVSGSAGFALAVNGTNFASGATVLWGGTPLTTTLSSSTQLMAAVPASLITTAGTATITVTDSAGTSSGATFTVTTATTALPTITNLSPASATAGDAGFTLTVYGSNFDSSTKVNWNGAALTTTFVGSGQVTAAVPASLIASPGSATITVTNSVGTSNSFTLPINTVTATLPTISGVVSSAGASVQLYAAGTSGYGYGANGPTKVDGSAATADHTTGRFSGIAYDCSKLKAPDDQLYLIATGTNSQVVLMTALGSCGSLSTSGTTVTINEVTTIASVYALSAFAEASATGVGIDIGAPAAYDATKAPKCDSTDGWLSTGKETCNYTGLVNAFKAVNNLVDIASGTARSYTPDYTQTLSSDTAIVNNSTVPTARINALADMLTAGGSLLPAAKPAGGTQPNDTLQAALDIAQNPGNNVSTLLGLVASQATPPYPTTLHLSGGSAPTDLTLALTFTGAGLGIAPGTISPEPVVNSAMAIDAAGNVWVVGAWMVAATGRYPSLIAEFSNSGKPITSPSTSGAHGGYQPGSNWTVDSSTFGRVSSIAIDPSGNLWFGGFGLAELFPDLAGSSSPILQPGLPTENGVWSMAIDGQGNVWAGTAANSYLDEYGNGGNLLSSPAGWPGAATTGQFAQPSMLFDSNGYLWAENNDGAGDLDLINTSGNTLSVVPPPVVNGSDNPAVPAPTGSIVYDPYGNFQTYNTNNFTYFDGEYSPVAVDGSGNIYGCGSGGGNAAIAAAWVIKNYTPPNNGSGGYVPYAGPIGYGSGTGYLDVNNAASRFSAGFTDPFAVPVQYAFPAAYVATGRGCGGGQTGGGKMVIDGLGHIFALSGGTGPSDPAGTTTPGLPGIIDEFTTVGVAPGDPKNPNSVTMISPETTGYTGTSSGETPAINPDPAVTPMIFNQITGKQTDPASGIADAAMDGSGNLWVLNADTGPSSTYKGNALVEYVGIGAPVVTPPSLGLANKNYAVRP